MSDLSTVNRAATESREQPALLPPVEVVEDANGITLYADLPGVPKENLDVRVEGDTLTIAAEMALPAIEGLEPTHVELDTPRYKRVFTLSKELDATQVGAELAHGVLKLRIPKAAHAQPRRIEVRVA
ncbi:MAG: Hsp20/alpha crystallin family protein [Betaproteobacteria bacterium]|nr:Hsp20/alpha crystallin family protein [Betaproteobacteria bacterium]